MYIHAVIMSLICRNDIEVFVSEVDGDVDNDEEGVVCEDSEDKGIVDVLV
jgi:hypothetical protein